MNQDKQGRGGEKKGSPHPMIPIITPLLLTGGFPTFFPQHRPTFLMAN